MTRRPTPSRRHRAHAALRSQTAAASALAGGCLAVIALWSTAARDGASEGVGR